MTEIKNKKMKDYSKGKIYIIRNLIDDRIYIGSTCQSLSQRMAQHRQNIKDNTKMHYKIYQCISELGCFNFYIELLKQCKCDNNDQLRKIEG